MRKVLPVFLSSVLPGFRSFFSSLLSVVHAYFYFNLAGVMLHRQLLLNVDVLSVLCKVRFSDFLIFGEIWIFGIFRWELGSGRVCNGLEMAVGFKWTDSQPISSLPRMSPQVVNTTVLAAVRKCTVGAQANSFKIRTFDRRDDIVKIWEGGVNCCFCWISYFECVWGRK